MSVSRQGINVVGNGVRYQTTSGTGSIIPENFTYYINEIAKDRNICLSKRISISWTELDDAFFHNTKVLEAARRIPDFKSIESNPIKHFIQDTIGSSIGECIANNQITIVPFTLNFKKIGYTFSNKGLAFDFHATGHTIVAIINPLVKEIEIFDPNGGEETYKERMINQYIRKTIFADYRDYRIFSTIDFCPVSGPQTIERSIANDNDGEGGYCGWWSLYYIETRLINQKLDRKVLIDDLIGKSPQELRQLILDYRQQVINLYGNGISFDEVDKNLLKL